MYCSAEMSAGACCCSVRQDSRRKISNLNSCTCDFSVYWDREQASLRAVILLVLLEAIGCAVDIVWMLLTHWGVCGFCFAMMTFVVK